MQEGFPLTDAVSPQKTLLAYMVSAALGVSVSSSLTKEEPA